MARKHADGGSKAEIEERRQKAFELRKAGLSYLAIGNETGVAESTAYRDVMVVLKRLAKQTDDTAREYRQMQLEQINTLLTGLWPLARPRRVLNPDTGEVEVIPPDLGAVDRIMNLLGRQARLLALDLQPDKDEGTKEILIRVVYGKDGK